MGTLGWCWTLAALLMAAEPGSTVEPRSLNPFDVVAVKVQDNSVKLDLPAQPQADQNYLLVIGSPQPQAGAMAVAIERAPLTEDSPISLASLQPSSQWIDTALGLRQLMEQRRIPIPKRPGSEEEILHQVAKWADTRSFHIFVQEDNFRDVSAYQEVHARLARVGTNCLVYVDREDWDIVEAATLDDLVDAFDNRVFPTAKKLFGRHRDVDRNGKFVILMTHWLDHLSNGKVSLGGFVRGGDFYRDVDPPFSNQCDMMYLNANLKPGKHLQTLLAHEYTHAITFSEHIFGDYLFDEPSRDEESWLNEAISHLAENIAGEGYSNLDYRVSTFLTSPADYRLVVPDYAGAGLWRCHGSRGSTYLFLRWCVDHFGQEILRELVQSNLSGTRNLEVATTQPFSELFRFWCVSLCLDGMSPEADMAWGIKWLDLRNRLETRLLAGPKPLELPNGRKWFRLASTGMQPVMIHIPAGEQGASIRLEGHSEHPLQVTAIRLPDDLGRATIQVAPTRPWTATSQQGRLKLVHESGMPVRWEQLSWERARLPQVNCTEEDQRAVSLGIEEVFPRFETKLGESLESEPLELGLFAPGRWVVKMVGVDAAGRRVAAWGDILFETE